MAEHPVFVRVSTPNGHYTVPRATAARAGSSWRELKTDAVDAKGRPLPPTLRHELGSDEQREKTKKRRARRRATQKPRDAVAATPTPEPEGTASGDTSKE